MTSAGAEKDWVCSPSSETHQQQQLASTPQANHLWQHQQQQECLMLIFLGSSSNQLVHLRPTIFGSSKLQCLTLIFLSSSSSKLVHLRPIIFGSSKLQCLTLTNLPISPSTILEWEGYNPDAVIKRTKSISKDDSQMSGKREIFKSHCFWEKMAVEQRNKTISLF
jgi:hypothetical protein